MRFIGQWSQPHKSKQVGFLELSYHLQLISSKLFDPFCIIVWFQNIHKIFELILAFKQKSKMLKYMHNKQKMEYHSNDSQKTKETNICKLSKTRRKVQNTQTHSKQSQISNCINTHCLSASFKESNQPNHILLRSDPLMTSETQTIHRLSIYLLPQPLNKLYQNTPQMESTLLKKSNSYRVSIRKQQIQAYKKSKRKEFANEQPTINVQDIDLNHEVYSNILSHITFDNLRIMDKQTFGNNIQMLIEIVSGTSEHHAFKSRFEPLLCILMEYFQYVYNQTHYEFSDLVRQNPNLAETITQNVIKLAVFNKIFTFIEPNNFLKLVCLIHYEIVPQDLALLTKTVVLLRQILSYSLTDGSVLTHYLSFLQVHNPQTSNKLVNKSTIFLALLNITYSQCYEIMEIVYKENVVSQITHWVEEFGFSTYEKEIIAGIYGNCIEYLCWLAQQGNHQQQICVQGELNLKESLLFLPLFQDLVKTQNKEITQKIIFVSINLLNTAKSHNLPCLPYLIELNEELVHNVVVFNEYFQKSEDLFILLSEISNQNGPIVTLLQFLALILNKYAVVYYKAKNSEKSRQSGNQSSNNKLKGLQNISKLLVSCQNMLKHTQLQNQQLIVENIIDFWCKEELFGLKQEVMNFVSVALSGSYQLAQYVLNCYSEVVLQLMDQSYQPMNEIEAQLKLINVFLECLDNRPVQQQNQFVLRNEDTLGQISVRLEDYALRATKDNAYIFKLAEISCQRIEFLLKNSSSL